LDKLQTKKQKSTEFLQSELKNASSAEQFIKENQSEIRLVSVAEYLNEMLIKYNLEKCDVAKRGGFAGNYPYQIFNGVKAASRDKLILIAIGFPLALEELEYLLRLGGHSELYVRNSRDAYIMFALEKRYGITETNELLFKNGKKILE